MKEKIIKTYVDYKNEFLEYLNKFKNKLKLFKEASIKYFNNLKNNFKEKEKRKKYLIGSSIGALITILLINLFTSLAFFRSEDSFPLIHAIVGNLHLKNYDYVLVVYLENANNEGKYHLVSEMPSFGYTYSGYKCQNNAVLNYDSTLNNVSSTFDTKDVCAIYFDLISKSDINVEVMLEEEMGSDTYKLSNIIPAFGYVYSHYECDNNNKLNYDSNLHKVTLETKNKDNCRIYFSKDNADITLRLFVENTLDKEDYIERLTIPTNIEYSLNTERSSCKNIDNERIDTDITYTNGYIEITPNEITSCEIYLDKNA